MGALLGKLFIVSTPIGNLRDITYRAIEVLNNVQLIAAEDTRHSKKLLCHYNISTPMISYFEHNRFKRIPKIIERLNQGGDIALITDAGTPGISDPAYKLIRESIINNISITAITGSSGGGKAPTSKNHHSVRSKDVFSYNVNQHRHLAEIYQSFPSLTDNLSFVPLSGPYTRGIYVTAHIQSKENIDLDELNELLKNKYSNIPFVRIQSQNKLSNVVGSNYCDISISVKDNQNFVVETCIDNLIKGASGNAVECMNLMFSEDQSLGLKEMLPLYL